VGFFGIYSALNGGRVSRWPGIQITPGKMVVGYQREQSKTKIKKFTAAHHCYSSHHGNFKVLTLFKFKYLFLINSASATQLYILC
jgi:hypothetical protein